MQLAQIRLQSQPAKIHIERTPAQLSIQQFEAKQSIQQPKAIMKQETVPAKLSIDQTEAWADLGKKGMARFTDDNNSFARQELLQVIATTAQQGDELMRIENGGGAIAGQAGENAFQPPKEFNVGWIPSAGSVKINYQQAKVKINIEPQRPKIETAPQEPNIRYQPGSVTTSISQYQNLTIDFENLNHVGVNFKMSI